MSDTTDDNYLFMDNPEISLSLFHPRAEYVSAGKPGKSVDVLVPIEAGVFIGGRFHMKNKSDPNILLFHGNGEIAGDYDDLGPLYNGMGMNLLAVDYRGYGRSTGRPTASTMIKDCHVIFDFIRKWLEENGYKGKFIVMGRSLGSASALELASHHKNSIDGLVIESGFAFTGPLLELLGINVSIIGFREENGFGNLEKIRTWAKPVLIIHAEFDHIIPFADGQALYDACPSREKNILKIPGANHNDIFLKGLDAYMKEIRNLSEKV